MARTLGSKNKTKNIGGLYNLKFQKEIQGSPITRDSNRGYIQWGQKNDYPFKLLNLYNQSTTLHSCIQFAVQSVIGDGVDIEAMKLDSNDTVPNYFETWDEFIRKITTDFMIYGSFAIQIIKNRNNKDYSFYHIPYEQVRWGKYDEDGQITEYYLSQDWSSLGKYPYMVMDAFDMREDQTIAQGKPYIYVYRNYSPSMTYYTAPCYVAAIPSIQAEIEMENFDLKHISNGFVPSGMLTLQNVETEKDKQDIIDNINRMFIGSDNANSLMINFRNNSEDEPAVFTPFSNGGESSVNIYADSNNRQINRILSSFMIPSRTLVGLPDEGGSGFNSEAQMLENAYKLYNKLTGNYNRNAIIKTLNYMFKMNGIDTQIILKPLTFLDETVNTNSSDDNVDVTDNIDENNIEEQKTTIE